MFDPIDVDDHDEIEEIIIVSTDDDEVFDVRAVPLDETRLEQRVDLTEHPDLAARVRERVPAGLTCQLTPRQVVTPGVL